MNIIEKKEKPKQVSFRIASNDYSVSCVLTAGDVMRITEAQKNGRKDYRNILAEVIWNRVCDKETGVPSLDEIVNLEDEVFASYINFNLEYDSKLYEEYLKEDDQLDIYQRFLLAVNELWKKRSQEIAQAISEQISPEIFEETRRMVQTAREGIVNLLGTFAQKMQEIVTQYQEPMRNLFKGLAELVAAIQGVGLTEEEKNALIESYQKWGDLGWTINPEMTFDLFDANPPEDSDLADAKALEYCGDLEMKQLFETLQEYSIVKKEDIAEATSNFEYRQYKSCVMLLFSIIDGMAIRRQTEEDIQKKKTGYPVGIVAGRNVMNRLKDKADEQAFLLALQCVNLVSCMEQMFLHIPGFRTQPDIINRNFVDHGMLDRAVSRKDCVQVFLLLYNYVSLLNWYESEDE